MAKVVLGLLKVIPTEIGTDNIKADLKRQGHLVHAVHRMHRRDGPALVCGLSGITVDTPYKRGIPGQSHRCQLYDHAAANYNTQLRCVKCLVSYWTNDFDRTKETGGVRAKPNSRAAGGDEFRPAPSLGCNF
ncbi:hypothetical protein EVAR_16455_1 [Eumeta japonica]|uniref:Uncharacterized protein n=1 Tax=Eumeta variegata TaxID=151549 RepID=A0A4C1UKB7_EUMVA|nr:hypothetical protein EVAR_16455_1 [Eumeta japonica]